MQSLAAFFEDNKPLAYAATVAALLVLIMVVFMLYRLLFGRRLRTATGGRARQPRLGIVDAYDLDRQRQLVLVRRDNVEHLIMIGGPTDVVIESAIVRSQMPTAAREKDGAGPLVASFTPPSPPLGQPAPSLAAAAQSPSLAPPLPARTEPSLGIPMPLPGQNGTQDRTAARSQPDAAPSGTSGPAQASVSDPQIPPIRSAQPPNAQATPPRPSSLPPRPAPAQPAAAVAPAPNPNAGAPGGSAPARPPLSTRPSPRPPLPPRPSLASTLPPRPPRPVPSRTEPSPPPPQLRPDAAGTPVDKGPPSTAPVVQGAGPSVEAEPRAVRGPAEVPPPRPEASQPPAAPAKGIESLESLEEEMAKLLGRPAPRREG